MLLSQYSANNFRVCTEAPSKAHVLFPPWLEITSNETQWEGTEFGVSRHEMSPGRSHLPNISEACLLVCFSVSQRSQVTVSVKVLCHLLVLN